MITKYNFKTISYNLLTDKPNSYAMIEINKIHNENCLNTMAKMPDGFIDLVVTSPPYDNLRSYNDGVGDNWNFDVFKPIAKELFRIVKDGGIVVWVVGDATVKGSETGTSFKQALFFMECGFNLHDTMIYQVNGTGAKGSNHAYWQSFEYMFVLTKGKIKTVNRIADVLNTAGGKKRGKGSAKLNAICTRTERGSINPIWSVRPNIWKYSAGRGDVTSHVAPFPEKLARDHIYSWSNEGDLVYDPFGGSGTVAKMAHLQKRNWILSEISIEYCELAQKRVNAYLNQISLF